MDYSIIPTSSISFSNSNDIFIASYPAACYIGDSLQNAIIMSALQKYCCSTKCISESIIQQLHQYYDYIRKQIPLLEKVSQCPIFRRLPSFSKVASELMSAISPHDNKFMSIEQMTQSLQISITLIEKECAYYCNKNAMYSATILQANQKYYRLFTVEEINSYYSDFISNNSTVSDLYAQICSEFSTSISNQQCVLNNLKQLDSYIKKVSSNLTSLPEELKETEAKYNKLLKKITLYEDDILTYNSQLRKMGFNPATTPADFVIADLFIFKACCLNPKCISTVKHGIKLSCKDIVCTDCIIYMIKQMQIEHDPYVRCPKCQHILSILDLYTIKLEESVVKQLELAYK